MKPDHPAFEDMRLAVEALATGSGPVRFRPQAAEPHFGVVHESKMRNEVEERLRMRIGSGPITSLVLQRRIAGLVLCLDRNGFRLPPPNFSGSGAVLDTKEVDTTSARWAATVMGCRTTAQLDEKALKKCLGRQAIEGAAKTNPMFQRRIVELPGCLRRDERIGSE
jgi:hypothetical protein